MTHQTTTISPDGQWMWDGSEWVPNATTDMSGGPVAPQAPGKPKRNRLGLKILGGAVGALALLGVVSAIGGGAATESTESESGPAAAAEAPAAEEPAAVSQPAVEAAPGSEPAEAEAASESVAQQNAKRSAENYLSFTAFSRTGLIEQLEFEGFSTADATYAVDAINVDWNEQAAKSAQNYLDFTAFSRQGLIEQLEFEGFTSEQAVYGVNTTGL